MGNTYKRIVKFIYVVFMPSILVTLDLLLIKMGKWNEMISDENYLLLGLFIILNIWGAGAVWLMMTAYKDVDIIPDFKFDGYKGIAVGFLVDEGKAIAIIPFLSTEMRWPAKTNGELCGKT